MYHLFEISSLVFFISYTITKEEIFRPFREWVAVTIKNEKITYLVNCPFCFSVWVTIIILFFVDKYNNFLYDLCVIVTVANVLERIITHDK